MTLQFYVVPLHAPFRTGPDFVFRPDILPVPGALNTSVSAVLVGLLFVAFPSAFVLFDRFQPLVSGRGVTLVGPSLQGVFLSMGSGWSTREREPLL